MFDISCKKKVKEYLRLIWLICVWKHQNFVEFGRAVKTGGPALNGLRALLGRAKKPGWKTGLKYTTWVRPYTGRGLTGRPVLKITF